MTVVSRVNRGRVCSFASGASGHADGYRAVREALDEVLAVEASPSAVFLASNVGYGAEAVSRALRERARDLPVVGASAASVIGPRGWLECGVAAMAVGGGEGCVRTGIVTGLRSMSPECFAKAVSGGVPPADGRTLLVFFSDVLVPDYHPMFRALAALRPDLVACGACSVFDIALGPGDPGFLDNWQVFGGEVVRDALVYAAFPDAAEPGRLALGFEHGFQRIGRPARVTEAEESVIRAIDGRPAREHFRRYIGEAELRIDGFGNLTCFSVSREAAGTMTPQYSLPLEFLEDGAVKVLNTIPAGSEIALCSTTRRDLVEAARGVAGRVRRGLGDGAARVLFVFSCAGRQIILGGRCRREVEAIRGAFGEDVPVFGFYSGAEFAPDPDPASGGATIYNAYTATVAAVDGLPTGGTGGSA